MVLVDCLALVNTGGQPIGSQHRSRIQSASRPERRMARQINQTVDCINMQAHLRKPIGLTMINKQIKHAANKYNRCRKMDKII